MIIHHLNHFCTPQAKHKFPYHLLCDPSFEVSLGSSVFVRFDVNLMLYQSSDFMSTLQLKALKKLGVAKGGKSITRSHIIVEK